MRSNKEVYVTKSKELLDLKKRIVDLLLTKRTAGVLANEITYILYDEIDKVKKELIKQNRFK